MILIAYESYQKTISYNPGRFCGNDPELGKNESNPEAENRPRDQVRFGKGRTSIGEVRTNRGQVSATRFDFYPMPEGGLTSKRNMAGVKPAKSQDANNSNNTIIRSAPIQATENRSRSEKCRRREFIPLGVLTMLSTLLGPERSQRLIMFGPEDYVKAI